MEGLQQQHATVYIIDDEPDIRRSFAAVMAAAGLGCRCYDSGTAFFADYLDTGPACFVIDIRMPETSGLHLLDQIREAGIKHPAIMVTGYGEYETVVRAFRQGAIDYFQKPVSGSLLLEQVQHGIALDRKARTAHDAKQQTRRQLEKLSCREREVLDWLVEGVPNKAIAWELGLSEKTVAAHRANLIKKLDAGSLAQAIVRLVSSGVYPSATPTRRAEGRPELASAA